MGQILHGCARTTEAVRHAIQRSSDSLAVLADRYHLNPKTVAKWKKRSGTCDAPMGPKNPRSTVLSHEEETLIVAFRKHTLLPLDDCLYALQPTLPHLSRSTLHCCLKHHGISQLPDTRDKPKRKAFKKYPIGHFHIDIAEVNTEEGRLYLFVGIDRTSKFAYAELHERQKQATAVDFFHRLIEVVPYQIHTVLTDNGIQFTNRKKDRWAFRHLFDRVCHENGIEHRLAKPNHPWTNGQVEHMNRTLKDATVKRYHYQTHDELRQHLDTFLMAYNYAKRLKALRGLTPYEYICHQWQKMPERFRLNPHHHTLGPNT